jgi:hypothetical protein
MLLMKVKRVVAVTLFVELWSEFSCKSSNAFEFGSYPEPMVTCPRNKEEAPNIITMNNVFSLLLFSLKFVGFI